MHTDDCKMFLLMAYRINFIFMAYEGRPLIGDYRQTDRQTEGRLNGRTNRHMDRRFLIFIRDLDIHEDNLLINKLNSMSE